MEIALWVLGTVAYLIAGLFVIRYFVNNVLADGKWEDTGREPGAIMLLFMTALWLPLAMIAYMLIALSWIADSGLSNLIKNLYKK